MKISILLFCLCVTVVICQKTNEIRFFQGCYDQLRSECFEQCTTLGEDEMSNWGPWDYYSVKLLGYKTYRKKQYNPCQDRCIQASHYECTVRNWEQGGQRTFKMYGRYPMPRVFIFEEFFSMIFCLLLVFANLYYLFTYRNLINSLIKDNNGNNEYNNNKDNNYAYQNYYKIYYSLWSISFTCAVLFHTKDTVMTEKMDYYSAVISIMFGLYVAIVRVFEIRTKKKQIIIGTILMMYLTYHLYYMNYVSFDYGYNQTVVIIVGITHSLLWCYWCFRYRYPHMKINLITQCGMWLLSLLELIDFPPLFGYMDAHSLWHGFSIFVTYLWFQFVTADAIFLLKKTKSM